MKNIMLLLFFCSAFADAKDIEISSIFGLNFFQQQVKEEIGGENFPTLYNYSEVSFGADCYYNITEHLSAGAFIRYDIGNRQITEINRHFNELNLQNFRSNGSDYSELWIGPKVRFSYNQVFLAVGYGLLGSRDDEFNNLSNSEDMKSPKELSSFAWLFDFGGEFELMEDLNFVVMIEYRVRYYDNIDGQPFESDLKLGTQSLYPLIGINYAFDL